MKLIGGKNQYSVNVLEAVMMFYDRQRVLLNDPKLQSY